MNKIVCYILGIVTGVIITFAGLFVLVAIKEQGSVDNAVTMFEQPGQEMQAKKYKVLQVVPVGALAKSEEKRYSYSSFTGPIVLFLSDEQSAYYDDQVITVPAGKKVRQIGTYQYEAEIGYKTVPIVQIME